MGHVVHQGTPTTPTTTASTATAAAAPSRAGRQPRVNPAAITMVSASTISTALAPKTASTKKMVVLGLIVRVTRHRRCASGGQ